MSPALGCESFTYLLTYLLSYLLLSSTIDCRMPDGGQRHLRDARRRQSGVNRHDRVVRQYVPHADRDTELRRADLAAKDDFTAGAWLVTVTGTRRR